MGVSVVVSLVAAVVVVEVAVVAGVLVVAAYLMSVRPFLTWSERLPIHVTKPPSTGSLIVTVSKTIDGSPPADVM